MKLFGPKEESRRELKRRHNKMPRNVTKFYSEDEIKKNEMGEDVITMEDRRGAYGGLNGRPEGKRQLGGARCVWAYDLERTGWKSGLDFSGSR